jgi:hypothetical protein
VAWPACDPVPNQCDLIPLLIASRIDLALDAYLALEREFASATVNAAALPQSTPSIRSIGM